MLSRRQILKQASFFSLASTVPAFLRSAIAAQSEQSSEKILVVIQLSGGNDGLNTIVPFKEEGYLANRSVLRLPLESLIKIDDSTAFHPSMRGMADLLDDGRLSIIQGVGYPNPNRSHDVSMAVWQSATTDLEEHNGQGWLGRALDQLPIDAGKPSSMLVASENTPAALRGRKSLCAAVDSLDDFTVKHSHSVSAVGSADSNPLIDFMRRSATDAYSTADHIQAIAAESRVNADSKLSQLRTPLARHLKIIFDLVHGDFGPRVYYTMQYGYDTHAEQLRTHGNLLGTLSTALKAFLDDIAAIGQADRVLVLCFSEFGRQVKENASAGTDHGTAGPVFLAGSSVQAGLSGTPPNLLQLDQNAPNHTVDFRVVYATLLENWLSVNAERVLGNNSFTKLQLLRS